MKKIAFVGASAVLASLPVLAATNPLRPGLPGQTNGAPWAVTAGQGYDATATSLAGNPASTMCVECHAVNPSDKIAAPTKGAGAYTPLGSNAADLGSHVVMNNLNPATAVGSTNSGGGFPGGFGIATTALPGAGRNGGEYAKTTAWAPGGQTGKGVSKYNQGTYVTAYTGALAGYGNLGTVDVALADMICESCHNVLVNDGNSLLLGPYANGGLTAGNGAGGTAPSDEVCVRCHGTGGGGETYAAFHANGNLPNFAGTARKLHHVLEGDSVASTTYNNATTGANDSVRWAPTFTRELAAGWCSAPYSTVASLTRVADPFTPTFRGECNVTGVGTLTAPNTDGDVATTSVRCTGCHRPHNAQTGGGAFILRTGNGGIVNSAMTTPANGIRRQTDVGNWVANKVYREYAPVCAGCHQGYGS